MMVATLEVAEYAVVGVDRIAVGHCDNRAVVFHDDRW